MRETDTDADTDTNTGKGKAGRRDRPAAARAVIMVTGVTGAATAAGATFGWRHHPALTLAALILIVGAAGTALGMYLGRSTARRAGIPRKNLRPLNRRIRRADIPDDPGERAEMSRLLAVQREAVDRPNRFRRVYRVVAAGLVAGALLVILAGAFLQALALLAFAALQLCVPLLTRRSLARLDRVAAGLRRHEQAAP